MRIFVTGGTGFIGGAVVRQLRGAGHDVLALARSPRSAHRLEEAGAEPVRGSLEEPEVLARAVARADGVVHTAFDHSSTLAFLRSGRVERAALAQFGESLRGTGRPLVVAGGFAPVRRSGPLYLETDDVAGGRGLTGRNVEGTALRLAREGTCASVVRLPAVHGPGEAFTVRALLDLARRHGHAAWCGTGENRIPAVHVEDAARVFLGAVERAETGARYHAMGEEGIAFRDLAETIGQAFGLPARSLGPVAAWRYFGAYAPYARSDGPASSAVTRELLGWEPTGPGLLEDLQGPEYGGPDHGSGTGTAAGTGRG